MKTSGCAQRLFIQIRAAVISSINKDRSLSAEGGVRRKEGWRDKAAEDCRAGRACPLCSKVTPGKTTEAATILTAPASAEQSL